MTHNFIECAAIIGATLLPLVAIAPVAHGAERPAQWSRQYPDFRAQWAPRRVEPNLAPYGVGRNGTVYLNGWSSSNNPNDCNKGCVNSNGG